MTKNKFNTLLATTAVLALSACGGSGTSDGSALNPTSPPPINGGAAEQELPDINENLPAILPQAKKVVAIPESATIEEIAVILQELSADDQVKIKVSDLSSIAEELGLDEYLDEIDDDTEVVLLVGEKTTSGLIPVYLQVNKADGFEEGLRNLTFALEGLFDAFDWAVLLDTAIAMNAASQENVDGTSGDRVTIKRTTFNNGGKTGNELFVVVEGADESQYVDAQVAFADVGGGDKFSVFSVDADGGVFTAPIGEHNYTGRAAVQWDNRTNTASGEVTMAVTFAGSSSTANISAPALTGDGTASFTGSLAVDTVRGTYGSTTASVTTDGTSEDAQIFGMFNGDASITAGALFDTNTGGENVSGVFGLVKD